MKKKLGVGLMAAGAALVIAALSLFLWNQAEAKRAAASVEKILPQLVEQIEHTDIGKDAPDPEPEDGLAREMTVTEIDGYGYIGYLTIPSLGLELPVMAEWDDSRLKIAPCRYAGSLYTDDLVVAAHNYTRHFGSLKNLTAGDAVYFTDMDGAVASYAVAAVEVLAPTAIEEMTAGEYALTLFTCTYGGQYRVTVRCDRAEGAD